MIEFSRKSLTNRIDAPCLRMQAGGLQSQALGEFHSKALECPCAYRLAVCLWGLPTYYLSASKSVLAGRQRGCPSRQEAERRREKGRGGSCVRGRVTHRVCAHSEQHRMCCATYHRGHSRKLPAGVKRWLQSLFGVVDAHLKQHVRCNANSCSLKMFYRW